MGTDQITEKFMNFMGKIKTSTPIVYEAVVGAYHVIMESDEGFIQVDNLADYIKERGITMRPAVKGRCVQFIREVPPGEAVESDLANGLHETTNTQDAERVEIKYVDGPEHWAPTAEQFAASYDLVDPENKIYKPKGEPRLAGEIPDNISFTAPWGDKMNVAKGGYLVSIKDKPEDTYGIGKEEFEKTYTFLPAETV